jgi:general secretion pathway protein C
MGLDTFIRKCFSGALVVLLAVAAYFQASGIITFIANDLLGATQNLSDESARSVERTGQQARAATAIARAIAEHDPFDHRTQLNTKHSAKVAAVDTVPGELDVSDPLNAARCDGVVVKIVSEFSDPRRSLAALRAGKEQQTRLRRVGDRVGDMEVQYIGFNPLRERPAVWIARGATLCQALLNSAGERAVTASGTQLTTAVQTQGNGSALSKDIAANVEKLSDTEFNVDRAFVDRVLENSRQFMTTTRLVPEKDADGTALGVRLFGVGPSTLLGSLGLQNGDRLDSINGFPLATPETALQAYAHLRTAKQLNLQVTRRGSPVGIELNIQ